MPELKDICKGKLSTRESLIREIQERVKAELASRPGFCGSTLDGPLGEQIAIAAGSIYWEYATPESLSEGVCLWLEKTFLQSPQDCVPRAEAATPGTSTKGSAGAGDGSSRVAASKPKQSEGRVV